jgi:hypothetical protein
MNMERLTACAMMIDDLTWTCLSFESHTNTLACRKSSYGPRKDRSGHGRRALHPTQIWIGRRHQLHRRSSC